MRKLWNALRRPSARWSVLALVAIGIVIGIALIVLPHVGIKVTSTTEFVCQLPTRITCEAKRAELAEREWAQLGNLPLLP